LLGGFLGQKTGIAAEGIARSPVALAGGYDRRQNLLRALELVKREVLQAARGKRILLKPNMVNYNGAWDGNAELSSSHVEQLEIVIEWFRHLGFREIVIAESTPNGMTFEGFETMGYTNLARKYPVIFKDLNQEGYEELDIQGTGRTVRVSRLIREEANFVVSLAKLKTHNNALATFSGKNVIMGCPIIDVKELKGQGGRNDKTHMHGTGNQDLSDNLFLLAHKGIHPNMAVIDGFQGMEGAGPVWGTAVDSKVAVASTDWLAADRVCCDLIDLESSLTKLGYEAELPTYLRYCAQAGLGAFSYDQIEMRGDYLNDLIRPYQLHDEVPNMVGLNPVAPIYRTG